MSISTPRLNGMLVHRRVIPQHLIRRYSFIHRVERHCALSIVHCALSYMNDYVLLALIGKACWVTFSIYKVNTLAEKKKNNTTTLESTAENFAIVCPYSRITSGAFVLRQQTCQRENSSSRGTIKVINIFDAFRLHKP